MKILKIAILAWCCVAGEAFAKECAVEITGNDQMKYDKTEISVAKDCTKVKLTLKHVGKLPKAAMGHNWVLVKTADFTEVSQSTMKAGPAKDYMIDDKKIITHTKLLGGGESDTITFDLKASGLTAGGDYTFFCSFPGHSALMKGKFVIK